MGREQAENNRCGYKAYNGDVTPITPLSPANSSAFNQRGSTRFLRIKLKSGAQVGSATSPSLRVNSSVLTS